METNNDHLKNKSCLNCGNNFSAERITKKYCSENCKQTAFYKRNNLQTFLLNDTNELLLTDMANHNQLAINDNDYKDEHKNVLSFNDTARDNIAANDKRTVATTDNNTYQPVQSSFIEAIAVALEEKEQALFMLTYPQKYWQADTLATVKWISIRLRNLIENLLRCSNYNSIEKGSFKCMTNAFTQLIASPYFNLLPLNYPFTNLLIQLEQESNRIAGSVKKKSIFRFQLSSNRKVQLIAARYMLAGFIPFVKFSELNFEK